MKNSFLVIIFFGISLVFCFDDRPIFSDDFSNDLDHWYAEIEGNDGKIAIVNDRLDIDVPKGCTIWFREKLQAPLRIEYTATVLDYGGPNDHVTDLNCFWMAVDPRCPDDILCCSEQRSGNFGDYHTLRAYYVGYGGHYNSKTRFRRYDGTGKRPLLPEHDLDTPEFLIASNTKIKIELIVDGDQVQYLVNGKVVFDFRDTQPYQEGWFAFRTVHNHLAIDDFKVFQLP